jgi:hypothetical protein
MEEIMNRNFYYNGPEADIASITGSPFWGFTVDQIKTYYESHGLHCISDDYYYVPQGRGPRTLCFQNKSGRKFIWIPSYGMVRGQDPRVHRNLDKLFYILQQAKVKILLVGGTSGVAEWRNGDDHIEPGDFVLPTDFYTSPEHRGLQGTELETSWPKFDLTLDDPFCTSLAKRLEHVIGRYVELGHIRRLHTPRDVRVALVQPPGITFETTFDIETWQVINRLISEMKPNLPPRVTLHGDCINPVLCRLMGIHEAYYHIVVNWAQGIHPEVGITKSLYSLTQERFPQFILELERELLETLEVPGNDDCICAQSLSRAPEVFSHAMTEG